MLVHVFQISTSRSSEPEIHAEVAVSGLNSYLGVFLKWYKDCTEIMDAWLIVSIASTNEVFIYTAD